MMYMLDTNICIYAINKRPSIYLKRLQNLYRKNTIAISSIVLAELQYGIENSKHKEQNQIHLNKFLFDVDVMDFPAKSASVYGKLKVWLKRRGILIGYNDLLIASHAISEDAILVTKNTSEFERIDGLKMEHWDEI